MEIFTGGYWDSPVISQSQSRRNITYIFKVQLISPMITKTKTKPVEFVQIQLQFEATVHIYSSHLTTNNQLCTNKVYIATSTNQERDIFPFDIKRWGGKSSLGDIPLQLSCWHVWWWPMFATSNPPVPLLIGRLTSAPSCRVIAIGRLIVKRCTCPCPASYSSFEIEFASLTKDKNNENL